MCRQLSGTSTCFTNGAVNKIAQILYRNVPTARKMLVSLFPIIGADFVQISSNSCLFNLMNGRFYQRRSCCKATSNKTKFAIFVSSLNKIGLLLVKYVLKFITWNVLWVLYKEVKEFSKIVNLFVINVFDVHFAINISNKTIFIKHIKIKSCVSFVSSNVQIKHPVRCVRP